MKVLSWNCRGLGSKSKEEAMIDLIYIQQPDIFLIQETKMEEDVFLQVSLKFWKKKAKLQLTQGAHPEALAPCGMKRILRLLTSSTALVGSSPY